MWWFILIFNEVVHTTVENNNNNYDACAVGWVYNENKCYKFNSMTNNYLGENWNKSLLLCQSVGGDLLSIADETENSFIVDQIRNRIIKWQRYWIGLNDIKKENTFLWSDNTTSQFTSWKNGNPNNQSNKDCVVITDGGWEDVSCDSLFGFICKINNESGVCDVGWLQNGSYCYLFYSVNDTFIGKSWNDSLSICLSFGGNLLSIENKTENEFIVEKIIQYVKQWKNYWIGYNGFRAESILKWSDKTISQFTNWNDEIPKNQNYKGCVVTTNDGWNVTFCNSLFGFICKFKKELNSIYIFETQRSMPYCSPIYVDITTQNYTFPLFFEIVKGLNEKASTVSFKSLTENLYLRHKNYYLYLHPNDARMYEDASFILFENKNFENFTSIYASNYPAYYITCDGYSSRIIQETNTYDQDFKNRSSFKISSIWSDWSDWSYCNFFNGANWRNRTRTCKYYNCPGNNTEIQQCNKKYDAQWTDWNHNCKSIYQTKFIDHELMICQSQEILTYSSGWTNCSSLCSYKVTNKTREYCNFPACKEYDNNINATPCFNNNFCGDSFFLFNKLRLPNDSLNSILYVFFEEFQITFDFYINKTITEGEVLVLQDESSKCLIDVAVFKSTQSLKITTDSIIFNSLDSSSKPFTLEMNTKISIKIIQQFINANYYFNISVNETVIFSVINTQPKVCYNFSLYICPTSFPCSSGTIMNLSIISKTQVFWLPWSEWSNCNASCVQNRTRICINNQWLNCFGNSIEIKFCDNICQVTTSIATSLAYQPTSLLTSQKLLNPITSTALILTTLESNTAFEAMSTAISLAYQPTKSLASQKSISSVASTVLIPTTLEVSNTTLIVWSSWSECSVTCGEGNETSHSVTNDAVRFKSCNVMNCPVNGMWSNWVNSDCSKSCGGGIIVFNRSCNNPLPSYNGKNCMGMSYYTKDCSNEIVCPVNGNWSEWSFWSLCNQPCNGGTTTRSRDCSNPTPQYGGMFCYGNSTQVNTCPWKSCKIVELNSVISFVNEVYVPHYSDLASDPSLALNKKIHKAIANIYKMLNKNISFNIVVHSVKNMDP
nr:uncharacterized protein LOC105843628 isoform X3 [Hydra vulgaris]